jgi:hypothetical protein
MNSEAIKANEMPKILLLLDLKGATDIRMDIIRIIPSFLTTVQKTKDTSDNLKYLFCSL